MWRIVALAVLLIAAAARPACASFGRDASCCLSVSNTPNRRHNIASYFVLEAVLCPVKAVVFQTRRGKTMCADPNQEWVRQAMQSVDEQRKKAGAMDGGYGGRTKERRSEGRRHRRKKN